MFPIAMIWVSFPNRRTIRLVPANSESRAAAPNISASLQVSDKIVGGLANTPLRKPVRVRNKSHLIFVAAIPCLPFSNLPSPEPLGRNVSDEAQNRDCGRRFCTEIGHG